MFCYSVAVIKYWNSLPTTIVDIFFLVSDYNKQHDEAEGDVGELPDSHNVTITPMDYVPGAAITKYLGYLSQHFLRETEKVHGSNTYSGGLGTFYHYQTIEANHIIRRIVHSMGGNALLSHKVIQHVMLDSDESRAAYHFFTVTGHIAQVAWGPTP